jgi:uncharacterized membrane protein
MKRIISLIQLFLCLFFAVFFLMAGYQHFVNVDAFSAIVPPLLPFPELIVYITGVMEIIFAIGLLFPKWRRLVGILLSLFLLAVLPANIFMAVADIPFNGRDLTAFQLWLRVCLQFPLILAILWASGFWAKAPPSA